MTNRGPCGQVSQDFLGAVVYEWQSVNLMAGVSLSNRKSAKQVIKRTSRATGSLDVYFGEKLRARRLMMVPKLSQEELGAALGVTFQQIQKYEKGKNRMSAAMMVRIAAVLKVDVQYFFDELPTGVKNYREIKTPVFVDMSLAAHGPRLITAFLKLKNDELRGAVADLAQTLARTS
jgi:transcriptional regulator with XRE-family HTH domain